MLTAVLLAVAAFAATNVDNLFVLLACFADARGAARAVVIGQYIGSMALVAFAAVIAALMIHIPRAYVGLIGVMPILIGVGKALELFRRNGASMHGAADGVSPLSRTDGRVGAARTRSIVWMVATVAIANGSDNLAVYVPLFAARPLAEDIVVGLVFVVMVGIWCALANWLVSHRLIGRPIRRYAPLVLPWVLILIGFSVMLGNGTLSAFGL
ncbi:cadmium resistance transporter [Pararobbsia silviterrae]|uniref:Cadmium transporter n=1 Tax=Pararobbsia silviterrae TaxID=1792498 RepID=A0A494XBA4_9BURK|nr:cadmium resistance transporter [Pararobbsia silviterrae]RKP45756.1 cadmium transporter [Pararobbsia silviterrae]